MKRFVFSVSRAVTRKPFTILYWVTASANPSMLSLNRESPKLREISPTCAELTLAQAHNRKTTDNVLIFRFSGDLILVSARRGTEVNHFPIHVPFDGRSHGDKGSAYRVFLYLASGLLP